MCPSQVRHERNESKMKLAHACIPATLALCAACTVESTDTQIANPAAKFCVEQGGTYALGTSDADGTCTLADGRVVDAWEYFRAHNTTSE